MLSFIFFFFFAPLVRSYFALRTEPKPSALHPVFSSQKGQQHKCRKFEWTSAVNEICKYFSKIELFWQIFSPMMMASRRWVARRKEKGYGHGYGYKGKRDCAGVYENK